jgi:NAD(P)-dependent dehydrogenase (short-subunit alcohol dehydrogenase family)
MYGVLDKSFRVLPGKLSILSGKKIAVIGGTKGIGQSLARLAALNGSEVTVVGRTFRDSGLNEKYLGFQQADLSRMANAVIAAQSLPVEQLDYIAFTNGIVPGNTRVVTAEGVEQDMAVSALSRYVFIKTILPRLKSNTRIFIWGFPGTSGLLKQTNLEDFNSERSYAGGFGTAHMNTVALNEALVHYLASKGIEAYGLNPGLIKSGIRDSVHGGSGGIMGTILESMIALFNPTAEDYVKKLLPVLLSSDLSLHKGAMFGQNADPIKPSPEFASTKLVTEWITAADMLATKALAVKRS